MTIFRAPRARVAFALRCFLIAVCVVLALDGRHPPLHAEVRHSDSITASAEDAAQNERLLTDHEAIKDLNRRVTRQGERLEDLRTDVAEGKGENRIWFLVLGALTGGVGIYGRRKKPEAIAA